MASKDSTTTDEPEALPFGTIQEGGSPSQGARKKGKRRGRRTAAEPGGASAEPVSQAAGEAGPETKDAEPAKDGALEDGTSKDGTRRDGTGESRRRSGRRRGRPRDQDGKQPPQQKGAQQKGGQQWQKKQRKGKKHKQQHQQHQQHQQQTKVAAPKTGSGMFVLEKGGYGVLRSAECDFKPSKEDIYVPKRLIQTAKLSDGSIVEGRLSKGQKHRYQLIAVERIDGEDPTHWKNLTAFKNLTSIDPDFHYAVGDVTDNVSMRIVDLLCPIGRGQRGLLVAPPRSGKTTILRQFAHGIELGYPDVHLMVLLVDERPEEATEWVRSVERGRVFVSTADESSKNHIQLAEAVWKRSMRMVELGQDVVILLDSITRLARAYNNQSGSGRTMSGGLDSRAMERPRKIFGSARNTETAGSLTILGTTLVDTGSRMDQMVFEEFKGTGNMELVLARRLADRRIFPAMDIDRTGTRKEEKLVGMRRLKLIHTLRRVLTRMNFVEAMELLITRLEDVDKTDDFLSRFEVDPEAE